VEKETRIPVVSYLRPDSQVTIPDRHLGLRTVLEGSRTGLYTKLGVSASDTIDLTRIEQLAQTSQDLPVTNPGKSTERSSRVTRSVRVGVAYDPAFCFYYSDNCTLLKEAGGSWSGFLP